MSSQLLLKPLYTVDMAIIKQLLSSKVFWEKIGASLSFRSGFCVFFPWRLFQLMRDGIVPLYRINMFRCVDGRTKEPEKKTLARVTHFLKGQLKKKNPYDHGLQPLKLV